MKKYLIGCICLLGFCTQVNAQELLDHSARYPISDDPNILYKTSMVPYETILFEANPIVHFSFFNNIYQYQDRVRPGKRHKQAWYLLYKPELRMYTDNSLPVKMPTYRITAGTQNAAKSLHSLQF